MNLSWNVLLFMAMCPLTQIVAPHSQAASYVFATGTAVPVSEFQNHTGGSEVVFQVKPDVLSYLQTEGIVLAVLREGSYIGAPTSIDALSGEVRFTTALTGRYALVTDGGWVNANVINHWDPALNSGRGGYSLWAADMSGHIGTLGIDLNTGRVTDSFNFTQLPPPAGNEYVYNQSLNIFNDSSVQPQVPDYDRYIGETWSLYTVQPELPLWFSEQMIKQSGYPVLFRNWPNWPDPDPLAGVPAWQVISGRVIEATAGKGSLATYILPPYWTPTPVTGYPVVCMGFYDLHKGVFQDGGLEILKRVDAVRQASGVSSIVIIWNGGGSAGGTRTFQRSAYDNAAEMFAVAASEYGADTTSIITLGGSRGAITALMLAGNPYHSSYRVETAILMGCPAGVADMLEWGFNTTYPAIKFAVPQDDVGYWDAWKEAWLHPLSGRNGRDSLAHNLFGTTNLNTIRDLAPYSDSHIDALVLNGTQIFLHSTSHDAFTPAFPAMDFYQRATAAGVPVEHQIFYGYGHNSEDMFGKLEQALSAMVSDTAYVTAGQRYFMYPDAAGFRELSGPAVGFEGANEAVRGIPFALNVLGRPGMEFRIEVTKISDSDWVSSKTIVPQSGAVVAVSDTIPATGNTWVNTLVTVPVDWSLGYYSYAFYYRLDGASGWSQLPASSISMPYALQPSNRFPVFEVKATENDLYFDATVLGYPGIYANLGYNITDRMAPHSISFGMIGDPEP